MYRNSIISALVVILSGCGGSGGSTEANNSNNNNSVQTNAIKIKAVYIDECGNETNATDAALLIHNNDYSNKKIIQADANGVMNYPSNNATETISVVMRRVNEISGIKPIELITYIDHPVIDMGTVSSGTEDKSRCNCQQASLSVNVPARPLDIGSAELYGAQNYGNVVNFQGSSEVYDIEQCAKVGGKMPLISTKVNFSNPDESFAALISDISQTTAVNAVTQGLPVSINSGSSNRQVSVFMDGSYHLTSYAQRDLGNVYYYPFEEAEFYLIDSYDFETIYGIPDVDNAYLFTLAAERTSDINQTFDLPVVSMDYVELFDILISETGNYALSNANEFDYMTISLTAANFTGTILDWYIYAPTSGQVPNIENLDLSVFISDADLEANVDIISMAIGARNFGGINGYDDLLRSQVNRNIEDIVQEKWNKFDWINFRMTMSSVGLSNMINAIPTQVELENAKLSKPTIDSTIKQKQFVIKQKQFVIKQMEKELSSLR
jgi:hypothetical protein